MMDRRYELHLYSLGLLGFALLVVATYFFIDNVMQMGFVTAAIFWFGSIVSQSEQWKHMRDGYHIVIMSGSIVLIAAIVLISLLWPQND